MRYPTNDAYGHCKDQAEIDSLKLAINTLNLSETIAALEENDNHHGENDYRTEVSRELHVAEIDEWVPSLWDENYEVAYCKVCDAELDRERDGTT